MVVLELFFRLMNNLLTCFNVCLSDKLKKREVQFRHNNNKNDKREREQKKKKKEEKIFSLSLLIEISHV